MPGDEDNDLNELEEQQNERSYEEEREEVEDEEENYDVMDEPIAEDQGDELDELQGLASSDINEVSAAQSDYVQESRHEMRRDSQMVDDSMLRRLNKQDSEKI